MKTSEALRSVLPFLWNGKGKYPSERGKYYQSERFLCQAAMSAGYDVRSKVQPILLGLLEGTETLESWLREKYSIYWTIKDLPKLQTTRKAWVEHLIVHYESIGD